MMGDRVVAALGGGEPSGEADFLDKVVGRIEAGDEPGLRAVLRARWGLGDLIGFATSVRREVRLAAIRCLGSSGLGGAVFALASGLHDEDPGIVAAAEDALWRLWFGAAGALGRRKLAIAVGLIEDGRFPAAIATLNQLIEMEPEFAEAYHQRGTALQLARDVGGALSSYEQAVVLEPSHFAAWCGVGRTQAELGRLGEAVMAYRRAMYLHPTLPGVRTAIRGIRELGSCGGRAEMDAAGQGFVFHTDTRRL